MPRPLDLARPAFAVLALAALVVACTPTNPKADASKADPPPIATPAPPAAAEEAPTLSASAGSVTLEVLPNFTVLDPRALPGKLDLLVRLRGAEKGEGKRPALDLAVILDQSGSMSGDKILAVKQAALDLLKELEAGDRVTLISYESAVTTHTERLLADPSGITTIRQRLLPIEATGGTALGPAMIQGLDILERAGTQRPDKDLAHVLLLSDGQANEGETRPEVLGARAAEGFGRGVSLSTLGVGLDYNEDLMTKLADQGGGRYHFIQDSQAIPRVLADEMAGLVATVATGMTLEVSPGQAIKVGAVFGYPSEAVAGKTQAKIGSLGAGQARDVVLRLDLPAATGESLALGVLAIDFSDLTKSGERGHAELALTLPLSTDDARLRRAENTEVTVRVAEVESAAQLEAATRAVAGGEYEKAHLLIQQDITRLEQLQQKAPDADLEEQIADLKEAAGNVDKAKASESERKIFEKSYKSKAYKQSKGSYDAADKKAKKSKKAALKDPFN